MLINFKDALGNIRVNAICVRSYRNNAQMLHLNEQGNGEWHVIHGKGLVPILHSLRTIKIVEREGDKGKITIDGHVGPFNAHFYTVAAQHLFLHLEQRSMSHIDVYISSVLRNRMRDSLGAIEFSYADRTD